MNKKLVVIASMLVASSAAVQCENEIYRVTNKTDRTDLELKLKFIVDETPNRAELKFTLDETGKTYELNASNAKTAAPTKEFQDADLKYKANKGKKVDPNSKLTLQFISLKTTQETESKIKTNNVQGTVEITRKKELYRGLTTILDSSMKSRWLEKKAKGKVCEFDLPTTATEFEVVAVDGEPTVKIIK